MSVFTTIEVDDVCTDQHLLEEVGDQQVLDRLVPSETKDTRFFRQRALEQTMKALRRRVPPITDASLSDVRELRDCVRFGALARMYERAMTEGTDDSLWTRKARWYQDRFQQELQALQPSIGDDVRGPPMSITVHRR